MGDSAAALWDSELLRARQWLAASRGDKQNESERLFQRVKAHIGYKDHQRSLQSEATASEDEDDSALDFLADVDAADMSALLQAEVAKAAGPVPPVEVASPAESRMPSAGDLLKPLDMPTNLASPKLKAKVKAVPMSQLDPKARGTSTTSVAASATLGNDASVQTLMQDLHLDVTHHSDTEETKTEESTPPHLLKNFGGNSNKAGTRVLQVEAGSKVEQSKYMRQVSSKSPQDPHKKKAATPTTASAKQDAEVADEMLSWVTGYRDPEVIRRKENMRRKRKHTHRYGMTSEEEQRQALLQMKQVTRDSDSESEDDFSSDYSPAEDEEVPEPDEPEVVDLLSDDYLDSDAEKQPAKRKRKRLRQAEKPAKKKKSRSRKPAVTHKVTQQDSTSKNPPPAAKVQRTQTSRRSAGKETSHSAATTTSASIEESADDATGKPNHPIELVSSGDETGDSDKGGTPKALGHPSKSSQGADGTTAEFEATESTILRLKIPKNFKSPQDRLLEEASLEKKHARADATMTDSTTTGSTSNKPTLGEVSSGLVPTESVAVGRTQESETLDSSRGILDIVMQSSDASVDDTDLSDTGTVDFEGEDLSLETEENIHQEHQEDITVSGGAVGSGACAEEENDAVVNAGEEAKRAEHTTGEAEAGDEDVSEAETEVLEDDEPDTDDLGIDYSDDSDSGGKSVSNENNVTGDQKDVKKDGAVSEGKSSSERHSGHDSNGKSRSDKKENKLDASTVGVQQFFEFTPLKLKPKAKTTTSTAQKPLPVHAYAETHLSKGNTDSGKTTSEHKKPPETPTTPSVGSNGLRPSKKSIATTTIMKGKYAVTRRSTKMLNPEDTPGAKRQPKSQFTMVPTKMSNNNATKDLDDVPLAMLAKEMAKKPDDNPQGRYLSYAGTRKTDDVTAHATETPRIVPKSRFGGGGGLNLISPAKQNPRAAPNRQYSQVNGKNASQGGYRREPQISIYDALHMDGEENASDIREGTGYKRPSRFKKMQEEAARNGTPMAKSRLHDTDWDKVPIPRKGKQASQVEKSTQDARPPSPSKTKDYGSKNTGKAQNKRRKKNSVPANKNSGPSYYGPQAAKLATPDKADSLSRGRHGRERSGYRRDDDRRRKRSPSPHSRDRDRYDRRDDRRLRGSSRSRSRSPSPRGRDYSSNSRNRRRSRSRSWSRERSSERVHRRTERSMSSGRDRDRQTNGSRNSLSPNHDSSKKKGSTGPPELGEVCQNGDVDRSAKKQKTSLGTEAPPSPGALASFDDDGDNLFISDSDDDGSALIKETEDIRFNLESVLVDEALMARQVYVTGVNPTVFAEQIEEDFTRFGVAVDRETGFPAIDIFPCQRNHLGRGDACVTFDTEEGAQEAVEELNSKNVKNSMIRVRRMDVDTLRILTVQVQMVRDTWKCTGTQCRADVSIWNAKCDKCARKRVYGPSNIKIGAESWLCALCFTANDAFATSCHGCKESLPEVDRSSFYTA
ncbi:Programmed cell death protein 4 [Phytophthora pseudosyringae]|uniref:Programmed cell death protein 4 n=1 Tax=Phytophthora pseudosyringae TaxID=221518 RepID=A0A8T1VX29_9STRA|nr:Programmed cell death protein 4 [Phytophthora pseudosyringae]